MWHPRFPLNGIKKFLTNALGCAYDNITVSRSAEHYSSSSYNFFFFLYFRSGLISGLGRASCLRGLNEPKLQSLGNKFSSSTEFEFNTSCGRRGEGELGGGWGS